MAAQHTPFSGTDEQRANLEKLCAYVERSALRPRFDMATPFDSRDHVGPSSPHAKRHPCDTSACFAGYGPAAGVPGLKDECWVDYSFRAFSERGEQWDWLFKAAWADTAPTPKQAAARARYLLDRGLPVNAMAQMRGNAPLSFKAAGS